MNDLTYVHVSRYSEFAITNPVHAPFMQACSNGLNQSMISKEQERSPADLLSPRKSLMEEPEVAYRALVQRIVASPSFVRSERLSSLLTYVCEMTLNGRGGEINEQKIGQAVFGRSRDYDSTIDGIVRTQASRLRQRLEQYFKEEGVDETMRVVIPRGGYVPVFERRSALNPVIPEVEPANPVAPEAGPAPPAGRTFAFYLVPWLLCVFLAAVVLVLAFRDRSLLVQARPHPLWSHIFAAGHQTLMVPADSGLVMFHNMSRRDFGLDEYLLGSYRNDQGANLYNGAETSAKDWLPNLGNRRYTSMVDLEASLRLAQLARLSASELQVRYARDLRPNDLKAGNVILMGASEANPWVELFERNMNFAFEDNYKTGVFTVFNRAPRPGEPARWDSAWNDPQRKVYGLVAYLPNLAGDGNVLILEGTSMSGTEGARDFAMDDSQLLPFLKRIARPDGTIPHFEVLLGTQNMSASAVRSNLLAWRTSN